MPRHTWAIPPEMCAPVRPSQSGLLRFLGVALLAGAHVSWACPAAADGGIRINEMLVNPLGADRGQEFVEISGPPGSPMTGIWLVVIEGDATASSSIQKGRIDNALNLGAYSIGESGLLLLRDGVGIIDCDPGPDVAGPLFNTSTVVFGSSATQSGFGNGSVGLENSSSTFLLVTGFTGAAGQDLDTDNDGTLDVQPWTSVLDAVSVINSSTGPIALAVGYAPQFGGVIVSALATGFDIPMLVRRDDGSWITAPLIGVNPTAGPPTTQDSGPYYWLPGREFPEVEGVQYLMTPGQPNGPIPNGDSPCGSLRVVSGEGNNALWSNWGYPDFDLAGSPVQFEAPPGSSVRQAVGAAVRASFAAPITCRYRFDLCQSEIADTVMVALSTCGDPITAFALNDDAQQVCGAGSNRSSIDLDLEAGQVVELAVGSYLYASDPFPLETGAMILRIRRDSDSDGTFDDVDGCPLEPQLTEPVEYPIDADGDGYGSDAVGLVCAIAPPEGYSGNALDCDDGDPLSFPGANEVCDGADNDCDGDVDEDVQVPVYADQDGDGAGDPATSILACEPPQGFVANADDACPFEPALTEPVGFYVDADGDGFGAAQVLLCATSVPAGHSLKGGDCDDASATVHPGRDETCATVGTDNDCDGDAYDVSVPDTFYSDTDGDGYGAGDPVQGCPMPDGYSRVDGDCDDGDVSIWPGAPESCDDLGTDNDCDGDADELTDPRTYFADADGDGAGDPAVFVLGCTAADGYVANADDECPADPGLVGAVVHFPDADGDGYGSVVGVALCSVDPPAGFLADSSDCNDSRADAYPGAAELCANWPGDNDCDGDAYDADDPLTFYLDVDGDGLGDSAVTIQSCVAPPGYVPVGGDGCPLNPFAQAPIPWYRDQDNDNFGNAAVFIVSCVQPAGYIPEDTDCDDTRAWVNPQAQERCDPLNIDEDCDGLADDADPSATGQSLWFVDADGDGYGAGEADAACDPPTGQYVGRTGDCDDLSPASYPGAAELCATAGTDNDCDGDAYETDAGAADRTMWYGDSDGDGAGDPAVSVLACTAPDGYVSVAGDGCPSESALVAPLPYFIDVDGDGYGTDATALHCSVSAPEGHSSASGDCNDESASVNPGAAETCNGIDDNCAGGPDDGLEFRDYYIDSDGDGYGDDATSVNSCASPGDGWVDVAGDGCPEDPAKIEPGACGCGAPDTDADTDGVADCIDNCDDLYNPFQGDCDGDGYGDACAIAAGAADCNANAVPDACDIASGAAADVDGDGQPDACQPDCNANALPDAWEIAQDIAGDCNANGIPDDCEDGSVRDDTGNMGALAAGTSVSATLAGHVPATTTVGVRVDVIADMEDPDAYVTLALNGVSVATDLGTGAGAACPKLPIALEIDVSAALWRTVIDAAEVPGTVTVTLAGGEALGDAACSNGLSRVRISYGGEGYDCDGDGTPDLCQLASGEGDCDGNGIFDACEAGGSGDTDSDGIPDSCERARGDFNLDGFIDGSDLSFVLSAWGATGDHDADLNGDGEVAGEDLAVLLAAWGTLVY